MAAIWVIVWLLRQMQDDGPPCLCKTDAQPSNYRKKQMMSIRSKKDRVEVVKDVLTEVLETTS